MKLAVISIVWNLQGEAPVGQAKEFLPEAYRFEATGSRMCGLGTAKTESTSELHSSF